MPIRWTAELDQIFLLKILESQSIKVDYKAIADSWPAELEKPTPKALSEHLGKLRRTAEAYSGNSPKKPTATAATPVARNSASNNTNRRGAKTSSASTAATNNSRKRKQPAKKGGASDDDSEDEGYMTTQPSKKVKHQQQQTSKTSGAAMITPRVPRSSAQKASATVAAIAAADSDNDSDADDDGDVSRTAGATGSDESASEFTPATPAEIIDVDDEDGDETSMQQQQQQQEVIELDGDVIEEAVGQTKPRAVGAAAVMVKKEEAIDLKPIGHGGESVCAEDVKMTTGVGDDDAKYNGMIETAKVCDDAAFMV